MIRYKNKILLMLFAIATLKANAQDTTAMLKEFSKVMSFSVQPYLHYTSITKMEASPVMQPQDTITIKGEFYKNETNLYLSNQKEDMFMEDSFFVQINHERKSIWISKVDMETKEKMNILPLGNKDLQELFSKNYSISKMVIDERSSRLNFETKQYFDSVSVAVVNIDLQYSGKSFLPELLQMNVNMKQQIPDEQIQQLKDQGTDTRQLIQKIGNSNYLVRNQRVKVTFENIDNTKEKAMQIPSWKEKLNYNLIENEFSGKGVYSDYEVIKIF